MREADMSVRERIAEILHEFYLEASMRKMTSGEFERFIDRIVALFPAKPDEAAQE